MSNINFPSQEATTETAGEVISSASADITRLQQEYQEASEKMLRVAAEFENYKKRVSREKEDIRFQTTENLLKEFLPVIDNLDRALTVATASQLSSESAVALMDGIRLVKKLFISSLEKFQIVAVEAEGLAFDPAVHEAIQQIDHPDLAPGTVATVFQQGYKMGTRLLRPSLVAVVKATIPERK